MSKFIGKITLVQDEDFIYDDFVIKGIKSGNKIMYKEKDITVTILLKENKIEMKRATDSYSIDFIFDGDKKTSGNYFLKEENKSLNLKIVTNYLHYDNKSIELEYLLYIEQEKVGHFVFSLKEV